MATVRTTLGVILKDIYRYVPAIFLPGQGYLRICNRSERLRRSPDGSGYVCDWRWTSDLHAPKFIPALGRLLMKKALADHSVTLADAAPLGVTPPEVSFIIGHRGMSRLPHLLATLRSIAAQRGAAVECIVVEQDVISQLGPHLPIWVRLVHTPPPSSDMPYCRSWAFNIGARHARSAVLVLHDNDLLVPMDYAAHLVNRVLQGYEVVNLKRFIFYLTQAHTEAVFDGRAGLSDSAPDVIVQNTEGGGSIAITRVGFDQIGGMDESFIGWGGEDNEFWERAQTVRMWPWGNLQLVHLWHAAQPGKLDTEHHTALHYRDLEKINPRARIARLGARPKGLLSGPIGDDGGGTGATNGGA